MNMTAAEHSREIRDTAWLYEVFRANEDEERAQKAELFAKKIIKNHFIIGFAGHFSAGKSSMINALTGETLLPASPIPTSANIVNVHKAEHDFAIVNRRDGQPVYFPENYDFDKVKAFCKSGDVTQIDIGHEASVLPEGITVMDTPGVDSTDDAHRLSTESALHVADMVFYVMDYNHVQSELNFSFTKELQDYTDLYLIVNQIDKHQDGEMSFEEFQQTVYDSFRVWGVEPKGIFFTSLKDFNHPGNDFEKVKAIVTESMDNWQDRIGQSAEAAMRQLKDEHLKFLEDEKMDRLETFASVLTPEEWENREDIKQESMSVEKRQAVLGYPDWKDAFERERKALLENANIMPYELRDALRSYLESVQPNFKVGMLFSGKKTEQAREERKAEVQEQLQKVVASQITPHLKALMKASLKQAGLLNDEQSLIIGDREFVIPFTVVEKEMPRGAVLTGDTVLNFAKNITNGVQKWFIAETESWKSSQKPRFSELTDDAAVEIAMKTEGLREKLFAISSMEEMDERISKVKRSLSAALPSQLEHATQLAERWEQEFRLSVDDMVEFDESMLEQVEAKADEEEQQQDSNAVTVDEAHVLARVNRTIDALAPINGFSETVDYLKRRARRLEKQEFTIALFGAFSAGKSSFSNALMGEKVLPVSPNPTTATINRIRPVAEGCPHETADVRLKTLAQLTEDVQASFRVLGIEATDLEHAYELAQKLPESEGPQQQVHKSFLVAFEKGYTQFRDRLGETLRVDRETFGRYVAKEELSCFVDEIDFYYDCELTRSGVTLVDTPGADSINARHTNVAFEYIRNADAILFITYYNHAFARADREFLIQLGRVKDAFELDKMFFVVNAIDLASNEEEKQAVINYVQTELQRFGIRFPRLFGVSSLQALTDREASGLSDFEQSFQHFLKGELKGMAVQSLSEEEQRTIDRFKALITQTERNLARKDERLEELAKIEQQIRLSLGRSAAELLTKETVQELDELLYYVKQRVFYRFNDFFKEAFNPSAFTGKSAQQALDVALADMVEMTAFDFQQEMRVTTFRITRYVEKKIEERFKEDGQKLRELNNDFNFIPYEVEETVQPEGNKPFQEADYRSVKSHYRNNRSFFEKNEKEVLRDALQALMEPDAQKFLDQEREMVKEWADFWIGQEAEGLRQHLMHQAISQLEAERSLLRESEQLEDWKKRFTAVQEGRV